MATAKEKMKKASAEAFDMFFSGASESPQDAPKEEAKKTTGRARKTAQRAPEEPTKTVKKVFSFRAEEDKVNGWRVWADARGIKVDELGEKALQEYIKRHPLTEDQQKIYELKLAQKKS